MLGNGVVNRGSVNHYAQRRDDSYRRKRAEIDRPRDRRRGARGQRQTAQYNRFWARDARTLASKTSDGFRRRLSKQAGVGRRHPEGRRRFRGLVENLAVNHQRGEVGAHRRRV